MKRTTYASIATTMCSVSGIVAGLLILTCAAKRVPVLDDLLFQRFPFHFIALLSGLGALAYGQLRSRVEKGLSRLLESSQEALTELAEGMRPAQVQTAIVILSAATLFLELVLIRWQGSLFPVFALYKNFTLLACFCGLGIGYALAQKKPLLLPVTLPVLAFLILLMTALRYSNAESILFYVPVHEESAVGTLQLTEPDTALRVLMQVPSYLLLVVTFALNVLVMMPVAQFCGVIMDRAAPLAAYGCNLAGSIGGVALLFALSWLWTGPVTWFAIAIGAVLWYLFPIEKARGPGLCAAVLCMAILAFPAQPTTQSVYSPYQYIERSANSYGFMKVLSGGTYFQEVLDLSLSNLNRDDDGLKKYVGYYELPYRAAPSLARVAIVGAGTGNDAAAALRSGAKIVDAVEIDPVILALGRTNHPEHPYSDPKVNVINDDARTFFRNTGQKYDAVTYGVLDSHILLSHGSNVRVDSFVYTVEGLREAYERLKPGGLMSVSFALPNVKMGFKIYSMLEQLQGAGRPAVVLTQYPSFGIYSFLVRRGGEVALPALFLHQHGLSEVTQKFSGAWQGTLDLPTDDWPFFYMDAKMYPASYVVSLLLIMALAALFVRRFLPDRGWDRTLLPFFFLGAGFMLIETKAITELGLLFGNTWHVVGIAIIGVLVMAFLSNLLVVYRSFRPLAPYAALLAAIALGYFVALHGGAGAAGFSAKAAMVVLLTSPLLFSGIVFSRLLRDTADLPSALAYNLMGAMLGGLLEYNSMQFGFASLYLIALGLYGLAWATTGRPTRK
ncbi:MAG: hypothetical protein ACAH83_00195 [Alphaproteobacteria bacterium]